MRVPINFDCTVSPVDDEVEATELVEGTDFSNVVVVTGFPVDSGDFNFRFL